ncbi:MAG: CAAX prenyl protease-related protein [bacterium]|nr:CAAX prenyl protease-related protein [bacterium]MCP5067934.1 CAAX prenyl protease-related protein [bacterium]
MTAHKDHGWWPYLAPYGLFLVIADIASRLPEATAPYALVVRVAVPGALLFYFGWRGRYPELREFRPGPGALADVCFGVAIAVLWVGPYLLLPGLPQPAAGEGFDPEVLGDGREAIAVAVRVVGFVLVTPFLEELFVRSFLIRYAEVYDSGEDFRTQPMAMYRPRGFWVTVVWFTLTHALWEWWVALPTGILLNLWLYRRRHLGSPVLAHMAANGAIAAAVLLGPDRLGIFL